MATKASFTADDGIKFSGACSWQGLRLRPPVRAACGACLKQRFARGRALMDKSSPDARALTKAVVSDTEGSESRSAAQDFVKGRLQGAKRDEIKQRAIDALRSAAAVVDQKAPSDAAAYKAWLLLIAKNVAEASKEGGFLGFGGVAVSAAEKATLEEIAVALGTRV